MKRLELNYTFEVLFIYFFPSQNQRAKAGSMAFRNRIVHSTYLAAGSFVFAGDAAEPLSLDESELSMSSTKHVKE